MDEPGTYTVFAGDRLLVSGGLEAMLRRTKAQLDAGEPDPVLIFEDRSGQQVDFDFRGTADEVVARASSIPTRTGPGRPKLGVVSREVSLLPRHWDWLEQQQGGISASLRRLVDEARKRDPGRERARLARDAAARFMGTMAGNLPGFEEASRALYLGDRGRFEDLIRGWPGDIRAHLLRLVAEAFRAEESDAPSPAG